MNRAPAPRYRIFTYCSLLLLCALGCNAGMYRAAKLPPELRCPPVINKDLISLAGVSGPGIDSSLIGPGDLLQMTVSSGREGEDAKPRLARVAKDGTVTVPVVGPVQVSGLEPFEASQRVTRASIDRGIYVEPHIIVEIESKAVNRITVVGQVAEPGVHEIPRSSSDLLTAVAAAGGFTEEADTVVEIVRQTKDQETTRFAENTQGDVQQVSYESPIPPPPLNTNGPNAAEPRLASLPKTGEPRVARIDLAEQGQFEPREYKVADGDIVHVMPREKRLIHVTGLVTKAGQFELPEGQDLRLLDALALAGGESSPVADKVFVIRHMKDRSEPVMIKASIAAAKRNGSENIRLMTGDTVSVEQTPATLIVDTMNNFLRLSVGLAGRTATF